MLYHAPVQVENRLLADRIVVAVSSRLRLREVAAVGHHGLDKAVRDLDVLLGRQEDLNHI